LFGIGKTLILQWLLLESNRKINMLNFLLLQIQTVSKDTAKMVDSLHLASATPAAVAAPPQEVSISLYDLLLKGGVIMIPIGILLVVALYVLIERAITIHKTKTDLNFMNNIKDFIHSGNIESARSLSRNTRGANARVIEKGISRIGRSAKEIEESIENAITLEIYKMEKNLAILSIIGRIAPMLGFIGTILGVIKIFYDIALSNTISIDVIAGGLYQKMICSASGLVVGVVAFLGYHVLMIFVDKLINKMQVASVEFLDLLHEPAN